MATVPIGNNTLLTVAAANHLLKLPTIVPEVSDNVPSDEVLVPSVNVLAPVVMFPLVSVKVFDTVSSTVCNVIPAELLMVRLYIVEPVFVWVDDPLRTNVDVPALNVPALDQFPPTWWVNELALNVEPDPMAKFPMTVSAPPAVAAAVPDVEKPPAMDNAEAGIVFVPALLSVRLL